MGVASSPDSFCYEISVLFHLLLTLGELSTHVLFLGANRDEAVFSLTLVRMDKLAKCCLCGKSQNLLWWSPQLAGGVGIDGTVC